MKQTISILVENQAGVLNRITGLFSRRAFNIDSLAVGVTDDPTISRITIIVDSGNSVVEQVEKQLNKLVDVIKVRTLEENNLIGRELMILKVNANNKTRQDIMTICEIMGAKVDDISPSSMTMELSDTPERLDTFQSMMRPFSILEVARTGVIAVQKGGARCDLPAPPEPLHTKNKAESLRRPAQPRPLWSACWSRRWTPSSAIPAGPF